MSILDAKEACDHLGISRSSLTDLCKKKKIRHMRVGPNGGLFKFRREWLDEYLDSSIVEVQEEAPKAKRKPRLTKKRSPDGTLSYLEESRKIREELRQLKKKARRSS